MPKEETNAWKYSLVRMMHALHHCQDKHQWGNQFKALLVSYTVLCQVDIRWDIVYVFFYYMMKVGQFVPNQNNNRCPETGALLVFEHLLEIEEWLMGKSMIPMSRATTTFCLLDTSLRGGAYVFI